MVNSKKLCRLYLENHYQVIE